MKQKLISIMIVFSMICSMLPIVGVNAIDISSGTAAYGGSGTDIDPYTISNAATLALLADEVNSGNNYSGKYFKLTADIDLNGSEANQ